MALTLVTSVIKNVLNISLWELGQCVQREQLKYCMVTSSMIRWHKHHLSTSDSWVLLNCHVYVSFCIHCYAVPAACALHTSILPVLPRKVPILCHGYFFSVICDHSCVADIERRKTVRRHLYMLCLSSLPQPGKGFASSFRVDIPETAWICTKCAPANKSIHFSTSLSCSASCCLALEDHKLGHSRGVAGVVLGLGRGGDRRGGGGRWD